MSRSHQSVSCGKETLAWSLCEDQLYLPRKCRALLSGSENEPQAEILERVSSSPWLQLRTKKRPQSQNRLTICGKLTMDWSDWILQFMKTWSIDLTWPASWLDAAECFIRLTRAVDRARECERVPTRKGQRWANSERRSHSVAVFRYSGVRTHKN